MAEEEQLIFEVKIDRGESEKEIDRLTAAIEKTKQETKALSDTNKDLTKTGQINSKQYLDNAKQIELNKASLTKNNSERKNSIAAIKSEDNSMGALKARLSANKKARDLVNRSTVQGKKAFEDINKAIKSDTAALLEAEKAGGTYTRQVGNYEDALNSANPALGGAVTGIKSMTKAAIAFIATPIGAVIGAIGLALGALTAFFNSSEEGQNELNKVTRTFTVIAENAIDVIADLGELLFSVFGRETEVSIDTITSKIAGLNEETQKEIKLARELADLEAETDKLERKALVDRAKLERDTAQLRLDAKDEENFSDKERLAFLREANALQEAQLEIDSTIAKNRLKIRLDENEFSKSDKEAKEAAAIAQAEVYNVEFRNLNTRKKLKSEEQALLKKITAEDSKALTERQVLEKEAEVLIQEDELIRFQEQIEKKKELMQMNSMDFLIPLAETEQQTRERLEVLTTKVEARELKKRAELNKKASAIQASVKEAESMAAIQSLEIVTGAVSGAAGQQSQIGKALALFNIGLASADAIAKGTAASQSVPFPGNLIATATTIATVIANIARARSIVSSTKFADGGAIEIGGKSHSQGGTKFVGSDGTRFEAERGENLYILNKSASSKINSLSAINSAYGGTAFAGGKSYLATGGAVQRATNQALQNDQSASAIIEAMSKANILVTVEDINAGLNRGNQTLSKAKVI